MTTKKLLLVAAVAFLLCGGVRLTVRSHYVSSEMPVAGGEFQVVSVPRELTPYLPFLSYWAGKQSLQSYFNAAPSSSITSIGLKSVVVTAGDERIVVPDTERSTGFSGTRSRTGIRILRPTMWVQGEPLVVSGTFVACEGESQCREVEFELPLVKRAQTRVSNILVDVLAGI